MERQRFFGSLLGAIVLISASGGAQTTTRVSVGAGGVQGNGTSFAGGISADGGRVAFASQASTLVAGDVNALADAFEHDLATGATVLISVGAGGAPADGASYAGTISADGRFHVFSSDASNLVADDTFPYADVFVHDRTSGTIVRASLDSRGSQADGESYVLTGARVISADGRRVVFSSYATNLAAEDWNENSNVFVRDLVSGTTTLLSADADGLPVGSSDGASISTDGRWVAFQSEASTLVPGDSNSTMDIFVKDLELGTLTLVSVSSAGVQGSGFYPSISPDGRFVGFVSYATNLVPGDTGSQANVFLHDRATGTTERVSVSSQGAQGNGHSVFYVPSITPGGRWIAFASAASNLVAGDTNGAINVFVRDRLTATTERVSVGPGGAQGNGDCYYPSIAADGRRVAFQSLATNLVAADTNGVFNVFVHDRGPQSEFEPFCAGDGSSAACPCGNEGAPGHGCDNAQGTGGASLAASGATATDSVVLHGAGFSPAATPTVIVIRSPGQAEPPAVFGDGLRCISTAGLVRFGAVLAEGGASTHAVSHGAGPGTFHYQLWYRNTPAVFCDPSSAFNTSNGLSIVWP